MNNHILADHLADTEYTSYKTIPKNYCVEILIESIRVIYQFPVWGIESTSMFIIIKEDSDILHWLQPGNQLTMKYYSNELLWPSKNIVTEVKNITKQEIGPFKGHFMVKLKAIADEELDLPPALRPVNGFGRREEFNRFKGKLSSN